MPMPLISVVIPSYNHARYIGEAIDSVLAQPVELEVLVRDDASRELSDAIGEADCLVLILVQHYHL